MLETVKSVIKSIAPAIGTALGGPAGGAAASALSQALLGKNSASDSELMGALQNATPEQIKAIKEADYNFAVRQLEIEAYDRDSARQREVKMAQSGKRDWTTPVLAVSIVGAFIGVMFVILRHPIEINSDIKTMVDIMAGNLATLTGMVYQYYFGSSSGSKAKDKMMAK